MNGYQYEKVKTGGWNIQKEDFFSLTRAIASSAEIVLTEPDWANLPEIQIQASDWHKIEDQGRIGSCQGQSISSCCEVSHYWATGQMIQLSRSCGYYESQRISGISGDRGSTIDGGFKLAKNTGIVLESDWPYTNGYDPRRPSNFDSLKRWKCEGGIPLSSYEESIEFLARKIGSIHQGISWSNDIDQQVGRNGIIESYSGRGGGGHSVHHCSYNLARRDGNKPYIYLDNSWSTRWGKNGRAEVSPRAFDSMIKNRNSVFIGIYGSIHPEIEGDISWPDVT